MVKRHGVCQPLCTSDTQGGYCACRVLHHHAYPGVHLPAYQDKQGVSWSERYCCIHLFMSPSCCFIVESFHCSLIYTITSSIVFYTPGSSCIVTCVVFLPSIGVPRVSPVVRARSSSNSKCPSVPGSSAVHSTRHIRYCTKSHCLIYERVNQFPAPRTVSQTALHASSATMPPPNNSNTASNGDITGGTWVADDRPEGPPCFMHAHTALKCTHRTRQGICARTTRT